MESFSKNMPCGPNTDNSPGLRLESSNSALPYGDYQATGFHTFLVTKLVSQASVNLGKGGGVKTSLNITALEPLAGIQCFSGIYTVWVIPGQNGTSKEVDLDLFAGGMTLCFCGGADFWSSWLCFILLEF